MGSRSTICHDFWRWLPAIQNVHTVKESEICFTNLYRLIYDVQLLEEGLVVTVRVGLRTVDHALFQELAILHDPLYQGRLNSFPAEF